MLCMSAVENRVGLSTVRLQFLLIERQVQLREFMDISSNGE